MRSLRLAGLELRRLLTGRPIVAIAVAVILVVPLLYGALYLWAFWDPYAHVKDLPVAVVNEDVAARSGDTTISAGADLVTELAKKGTMRWEVMSASEASAALEGHTVYMALRIPRGFSTTLASADTSSPERAALTVSVDEADNMLASQIGARVLSEVRAAASASASRGYFDAMWVGFANARSGMSEAATGAVKLSDGLVDATSGSITLRDGVATAHAGSTKLASGVGTLASGARSLTAGAATARAGASTLASRLAGARDGAALVDGGAKQLAGGLDTLSGGLRTLVASGPRLTAASAQLASGAKQVSDGVGQALQQVGAAADASHQLAGGASQVDAALQAYAAAHPDATADPTFAAALAGSHQVADGLGTLTSQLSGAGAGAGTLADGAARVRDGAAQLDAGLRTFTAGVSDASAGASSAAAGAHTVTAGTTQLADGMTTAASGAHALAAGTASIAAGSVRLAAGATDASSGSRALSSGIAKLEAGAGTLSDGLRDASTGSRELASGLTAGVASLPNDSQSVTDRKSEVMSDPVALDTVKRTEVANYGTGFAPYFVPLALWVGTLVTFFLMKPVNGRALMSGAPDAVVALSGYWPAALVGSLQAVILLAVVQAGLGLTLRLPVLTYAVVVLAALAFVALVQWLSFALGSAPGKLASIVLLMLQLTSAAGTFPIETAPAFFRTLHPFLPMTYVVDALRQTIAGGDVAVVARCALALACFLALGLIGTLLAVHRQRTLTMDRLRPALTL
jgi:putative membrane protein